MKPNSNTPTADSASRYLASLKSASGSSNRSTMTRKLLAASSTKQSALHSSSRAPVFRKLRASESIVAQGLEALLAAGLILVDDPAGARYRPASAELAALAEGAARLYAQRPDAVRRLIVGVSEGGLAAFADAFRLRRD